MQDRSQYQKEWRARNAEKLREYARKWREENKDALKEYHKEYGKRHAEKARRRSNEWYKNNKERAKEYAKNNRERISARMKKYLQEYYRLNKDTLYEKNAEYRKKHAHRRREMHQERMRQDECYRASVVLRARIMSGIRAHKAQKTCKTIDLLGCTYAEARAHIEKQFTDGMSWDNHGKWHIDHIKPLASFDLSQEHEQRKAFHYTNLQPLWAHQNLKKGARMVTLLP